MKRLGRLLTIATAVLLTAGWLGAESVLRKLSDELAATAKTVTPSVVELRFEGPTLTQEVRSNDGAIRIRVQITPGPAAPARGSGVVMSRDGYILTAAEHLRGRSGATITATLDDGSTLQAKLIGRDARSGLALLKVDAQDLTPVSFADKTPPIGSLVVSVGDTAGLGKSIALGMVSASQRAVTDAAGVGDSVQFPDLIQVTNPVTPSDLGGLVADLDGRLVGILHSSMTGRPLVAEEMGNAPKAQAKGGAVRVLGMGAGGPPQVQGVSFATPAAVVKRVFEALRDTGRSPWGYLGLYYNADKVNGLTVTNVVPQSPAAAAGVRAGDVVTALTVPGKPPMPLTGVDNPALTFSRAVGDAGTGAEVTLSVRRDGQPQEVRAKLADIPEMPEKNFIVFSNFKVDGRASPAPAFMQHPWLGVELDDSPAGPTVAEVAPNSPAERNGIAVGDVFTRVGDADVKTSADVAREIEKHKPGAHIALSLKRGATPVAIGLELGLQPGPVGAPGAGADLRAVLAPQTWLGIEARDTPRGLTVSRVIEGSPAEKSGILLNDLIVRVDDKHVAGVNELRGIVLAHKPGDTLSLVVQRDGKDANLTAVLGTMGEPAAKVAP